VVAVLKMLIREALCVDASLCLIAFVVCPLLTVVNVQSKSYHACNEDQLFGVLIILIQL
jgi:hypothetical protein